jgi:hypothetical protein
VTAENPSIFLATPCYGGLAHALFMRSLLALRPACAARGVGLHVELGGGEALIGRGRAAMMAAFLASPSSHLLFVDADVAFSPEAVFRLLDVGRDVAGGLCPARAQPDSGVLTYEVEPLSPPAEPTPEGFCRVASIGAGFLLISRAAAQRMVEGYPQLRARLDDLQGASAASATMVFDPFVDAETRRYLVDHQAFCHRWRALGGEVWADLHADLSRVGSVVRSGDPAPSPAGA